MNEEFDEEDNIDFFNSNFVCDDEKQIIDLYKVEKTVENNDRISKKIQIEKYNHPLFLNYNYCLFCLERRKTKYNQNNLDSMHNKVNMKIIGEFLERNQISLKKPKNKEEKLSKRRFIHSYEMNQKKSIENYQCYDSDTELYIEKNNKDNPYAKSISKKFRMTLAKRSKSIQSNKKDLKKSSKQLSPNLEINKIYNENNDKVDRNLTKKNINKIQLKRTYNEKINKSLSKKNVIFPAFSKVKKNKGEQNENSIFNAMGNNTFGLIANYFNNNNEKEDNSSMIFLDQINETEDISLQYFEKNEKCGICLDDIKDKFTLFCGDFFCRDCIIKLLEDCINNIGSFDKMKCPRCDDPIDENTIKFLLSRDYFEKYKNIKMRIEGLKDNKNIPCPFPDCEGFARKDELKNGTLLCQKGHIFCNKCFEIVHRKFRENPKNHHSCIQKFPETEKYLTSHKSIRKCPQCHSWVQRESGKCNSFRCCNIWCNYYFCWICGKKCDSSHYKNPLSTCFRLENTDVQGKMIDSYRIRRIRCILISLLILLILLPIICIFFSFFLIVSFAMYFQFDGKELRNVRFHSKIAHKIFYAFYAIFIALISIGLIPFGYICLVLLIILIPILIIIHKCKKKDDF